MQGERVAIVAKKHALKELPKTYEPGFLATIDRRTELFARLRDNYTNIATDLGGEAELSNIQHSLVERFVFLDVMLNHIEAEIAKEPARSGELLGRWIQGVNSLSGLAKTLGIERKMKQAPWMEAAAR